MDADQYSTGEGPCVAASVEGRWFHVERLETESRWPSFIPQARTLGINSILSSPLLSRDRPVGALNIYSRSAGAFSPREQSLAALFAREASIVVRDAGIEATEEELGDRLTVALRSREVISQAQGVLMARDGLTEEDAYASLRRFSEATSLPLVRRAEDVVASTRERPADRLDPERPQGKGG